MMAWCHLAGGLLVVGGAAWTIAVGWFTQVPATLWDVVARRPGAGEAMFVLVWAVPFLVPGAVSLVVGAGLLAVARRARAEGGVP